MVKSEHIHMSVDTIHTGVNVEHCGASLSEQHSAASFDQDFTSSITKLQDTGHACLHSMQVFVWTMASPHTKCDMFGLSLSTYVC